MKLASFRILAAKDNINAKKVEEQKKDLLRQLKQVQTETKKPPVK